MEPITTGTDPAPNTGTQKSLEELVWKFGGPHQVARLAEVGTVNFWRVRTGKVVPQRAKASRIAAVFGLKPEKVVWPKGFTEDPPHVPPRRGTPKVDLSELYEDGVLRGEIEALIEREVQRRMAAQTAAQQVTEGT